MGQFFCRAADVIDAVCGDVSAGLDCRFTDGGKCRYADLSCIHVSADCRGEGLGRLLFLKAAESAVELGAEKLYISAHSSVESQAFYRSMGCAEAEEYNARHVELEPCDCQLEYLLG